MKSSFNSPFKISDEDISININRCAHLDGDLLLNLKWKKKVCYNDMFNKWKAVPTFQEM